MRHFDEFYLLGTRDRRMNSLPRDKFGVLGQNFHALIVEKEVDERLACIGMSRLSSRARIY